MTRISKTTLQFIVAGLRAAAASVFALAGILESSAVDCDPCQQIKSIRLNRVRFFERPNPSMEPCPDMKEISVSLAGDAPDGYDFGPVEFINAAGHAVNPAPEVGTVEVTESSGGSVISGVEYVGGGMFKCNTNDNSLPGDTADIVISANATGTDDDATIHVTITPDRVGVVNVDGVVFTERPPAADPAPAA